MIDFGIFDMAFFPNGMTQYVIGGLLIGLGVAMLYVTSGRPGGVSTFFSAAWSWLLDRPFFRQKSFLESRGWRLCYALGLVAGGTLYLALGLPVAPSAMPAWKLALGGVLIGFGARMGGGCTSGHGICGMASLSPGSIVMVGVFLSTAIATAAVLRTLGV